MCRELGADAAVNYMTEDVDAAVGEFAPDGVNVFWETLRHDLSFEDDADECGKSNQFDGASPTRSATSPFGSPPALGVVHLGAQRP
ncbi:MAG: hypothetical protein ISR77_10855 [Pirellulaceae bacterium]|nr:hypothetical protein [Pirellulaceae bacterium]